MLFLKKLRRLLTSTILSMQIWCTAILDIIPEVAGKIGRATKGLIEDFVIDMGVAVH
jgi:hypothetical protein